MEAPQVVGRGEVDASCAQWVGRGRVLTQHHHPRLIRSKTGFTESVWTPQLQEKACARGWRLLAKGAPSGTSPLPAVGACPLP